ncbi:MAG: Oligopeptide ABC transporter, periplasmic oligopeptide-binding protein OppA [uncultured Thermomicrobiales bacterium]|uniref:Oligopeptide ABC transporter, periplasmic oligopeptide-binding protein OppA n=1 Tax=uncultured Thermomicrobiales bacterium TaxID=1645740 RepID=A0A6J4U0R4_9BACT|nr:MAG: Oligopeptide ABC transporter, periplasmic oligopeptide-binding protein OppA [uncultured Thermomicrobiales bacterium]
MTTVDWSVLSGPRVSRRTLIGLAAATGAVGFAGRLAATAAAPRAVLGTIQDQPKQGGTLRLGFGISQIPTLDPAQETTGIVAGELLGNLFSSLVQFDEQLGLKPDLAETWQVSEDGLHYTFTLREGLTFHNGDTLTSEDVRYTYERTSNPDFASPHANKLAFITDVATPDERTVAITLGTPYAPFLSTACSRGPGRALTPVPRRPIEEMGDQQFGLTPVGSGPFMLVPETANTGGEGFEMIAFEGWYGGRPLLDKIVVQIIPEPSSRLSALEAGDVDMLDIVPPTGSAQLAQNPDLTLVDAPGTNWWGVSFNRARAPWDNPDARMAVAKAVDRQALIDTAFFGLGVPSVGPIAPAFGWAYVPPEEVETPQAFDLAAAKALAERAGLTGAKSSLLASEDDRPHQVLRNILAEIGLDLTIDKVQTATYFERRDAGDYDTMITGSVVDADPDDGHFNFFHSEGPWNTYGYVSEEADRLIEATREATDPTERAKLFRELQTLLQAEVPFAFLFHQPDQTAFHTDVQGYVPIPEMRYLETVWLDR